MCKEVGGHVNKNIVDKHFQTQHTVVSKKTHSPHGEQPRLGTGHLDPIRTDRHLDPIGTDCHFDPIGTDCHFDPIGTDCQLDPSLRGLTHTSHLNEEVKF